MPHLLLLSHWQYLSFEVDTSYHSNNANYHEPVDIHFSMIYVNYLESVQEGNTLQNFTNLKLAFHDYTMQINYLSFPWKYFIE